jgi:hypothetical protein
MLIRRARGAPVAGQERLFAVKSAIHHHTRSVPSNDLMSLRDDSPAADSATGRANNGRKHAIEPFPIAQTPGKAFAAMVPHDP